MYLTMWELIIQLLICSSDYQALCLGDSVPASHLCNSTSRATWTQEICLSKLCDIIYVVQCSLCGTEVSTPYCYTYLLPCPYSYMYLYLSLHLPIIPYPYEYPYSYLFPYPIPLLPYPYPYSYTLLPYPYLYSYMYLFPCYLSLYLPTTISLPLLLSLPLPVVVYTLQSYNTHNKPWDNKWHWLLKFQVALVTFATYTLVNLNNPEQRLTADKAFVALSLFNVLRFPLATLPTLISSLVQASVSVKRLRLFLKAKELDPTVVDWSAEPASGNKTGMNDLLLWKH